ncbi:MAG: lipopolysaccharide biosynthesis protein [Thermoanaerobaculia bacterium]
MSGEQAGLRFGRGGGSVLVAHGLSALLAFAWSVIAARVLKPAAFGDYSTGILIATILSAALWPFGLITAQLSSRFAARLQWGKIAGLLHLIRRRLLPAAAVVALALSLVLAMLAGPLHYDSRAPLIAAAGLWFALALASIPKNLVRALGLWRSYSWLAVVEALARLALGGAALAIRPTATVAIAAWAASTAAFAAAASRVVRRGLPDPLPLRLDRRRLTSLIAPAALVLTLSTSWQFVDLLIVRWKFGAEPSGLYGAAHTLGRTILIAGMTLDVLFVPLLSRAGLRGDRASSTVRRMFGAYALLVFPLLVLLGVAARPLMTLLFGTAFLPAASLALPSALASFFTYGSAVLAQGLLSLHALRALLVWAGYFALAVGLMAIAPDMSGVAWIAAFASGGAFATLMALLLRRIRT